MAATEILLLYEDGKVRKHSLPHRSMPENVLLIRWVNERKKNPHIFTEKLKQTQNES